LERSNRFVLSKLPSQINGKRVLLCVLKCRYPFLTRLENFQKPSDVLVVGIFAEWIRSQLFPGSSAYIDSALYFPSTLNSSNVSFESPVAVDPSSNGDDRHRGMAAEIEKLVADVLAAVSEGGPEVRLLEGEESVRSIVAEMREKFNIPGEFAFMFFLDMNEKDKTGTHNGLSGLILAELHRLGDNLAVKTILKSHSLPTTAFHRLHFTSDIASSSAHVRKSAEEVASTVELTLPTYPIHAKPVRPAMLGAERDWGKRIDNRAELVSYISERESRKGGDYLLEEHLTGRKFWVHVCLLPNGDWRPLLIVHCGEQPVNAAETLRDGDPIAFYAGHFDQLERRGQFPRLREFIGRVIAAIQPQHPHLFTVRGVQLEPRTDRYRLTKCGYLLNAAVGASLSYTASGVSTETALLSAHLDVGYTAAPHHLWAMRAECRIFECLICWPHMNGRLVSRNVFDHTAVPEDFSSVVEVGSAGMSSWRQWMSADIQFTWYADAGAKLRQDSTFAHFLVSARLVNHDSYASCVRDVRWLMRSWRPNVDRR